ncbi:HEAT repeat domain-containing protein [Haliangium sp.]|uniref:HEAT repeat domain-containing protein n=1 Tax=Haliangium sp. TaxID=2663208 RepID=UPI003D0F71E2
MSRDTYASIESTADMAEGLVAQGKFQEAERYYRELVAQTHIIEYEYNEWLRRLADVYRQLGRHAEAGYILLYLHWFDDARTCFRGERYLAERARILDVEERWRDAAELYGKAGRPVHAAVAYERAGRHAEASAAWEALMKHPGMRERDYELALVHFNHGMAQRHIDPDSAGSRRSLIDAQRRLEQVADDFETAGERERAFDCYQILLKLGKDSGQFENLAEGYINCIRVLEEDNLKFYVLQYYEDFITLALERGELHAAASLYQEAADYSSRTGLPYDRRYQSQAAVTWARCAERYLVDKAPVELAENAFLAAIGCYSAVGDYPKVRENFGRLSELPLSDKSKARYARIAARYPETRTDQPEAPGLPDYLKQQNAYAEIWFVDLLEWELAGDPRRVAASIVGNLRYPNGIRRRALVVILTMAAAAARGAEHDPETLAKVSGLLGELQSYAALSPLERLYGHDDPRVRRAAVEALRFLYFKRSFGILRRALREPDPGVRQAAIRAIGGLHFPHAFNPLASIYRDSVDADVQAAALESIGKIQSIEAGEFLIMVLRQEEGELREVAKRALGQLDNADIYPILRHYHELETNPELRELLAELLRRGMEQATMRTLR